MQSTYSTCWLLDYVHFAIRWLHRCATKNIFQFSFCHLVAFNAQASAGKVQQKSELGKLVLFSMAIAAYQCIFDTIHEKKAVKTEHKLAQKEKRRLFAAGNRT